MRWLEVRVKLLDRSERSTGCLVPLDYPSVPSDTVAGRVLAGTRRVLAGTIFIPRIYKIDPSATQVQTAALVLREPTDTLRCLDNPIMHLTHFVNFGIENHQKAVRRASDPGPVASETPNTAI